MKTLALAAVLCCFVSGGALAAGDLATKAEKLPELKLGAPDNDFFVSQTEYQLETGKAYRLPITSSGAKEMKFEARDFYDNIWIRQIVVNDLEIHATVVRHLEFDSGGTMELFFTPIRTGEFEWRVPGLEEKGMKGKFIVK